MRQNKRNRKYGWTNYKIYTTYTLNRVNWNNLNKEVTPTFVQSRKN